MKPKTPQQRLRYLIRCNRKVVRRTLLVVISYLIGSYIVFPLMTYGVGWKYYAVAWAPAAVMLLFPIVAIVANEWLKRIKREKRIALREAREADLADDSDDDIADNFGAKELTDDEEDMFDDIADKLRHRSRTWPF